MPGPRPLRALPSQGQLGTCWQVDSDQVPERPPPRSASSRHRMARPFTSVTLAVCCSVALACCKAGRANTTPPPAHYAGAQPVRLAWPASANEGSFEDVALLPTGHDRAGSRIESLCIDLTRRSARRRNDRKQLAQLTELYPVCGPGFGIAWRIGHLHLAAGETEKAGDWLIRELSAPYPYFAITLQDLGNMLPSLTEAHRDQLRRLGATPEFAMWLPTTELQMGYIGAFVCNDGARFMGQALVERAGVRMEQISYLCLDGETGRRYFVLPNITDLLGR